MENYQYSLFRRIKPEYLKAIYDYFQDSPALLESIINELKEKWTSTDIQLNYSLWIYTACVENSFGHGDFELSKYYDLFN